MGLMELFIFMIMMEEEEVLEHNEVMLSSLLLFKLIGVVLALSFGVFLFIIRRLRNRRVIPPIRSLPSQSLSSHSGGNKIDYLDESLDLEDYVGALQEANDGLRKENFELAEEIDRLESKQCAFYEEQVYLKWVNACLRYEVRNYKAPPGKTMARDLNNNMSPKSHEKAKQLILEYTNPPEEDSNENNVKSMDFESGYWSSSQSTSPAVTDSMSFEDRIMDVSSSAMKPKRWNKDKILRRVKRLLALQKSHCKSSSMENSHSITTNYNAAGERRNPLVRKLIGRHSGKFFSHQ